MAANLLHGYRPEWSEDKNAAGFFSPRSEPFVTPPGEQAPVPAMRETAWSEPELSLHRNVKTLLGAIFDYRVLPFLPGSADFDIPAGELLLPPERHTSTLASLGARVGVDLAAHDAAGGGFALVKMRRVVGAHLHEALHSGLSRRIRLDHYWSAPAKHAMARLRVARRIVRGADREAVITQDHVSRYLDYFYQFGTHFVSRIEVGGLLLQIFAVQPRRFGALENLLRRETGGSRVTGAHALGFHSYLGPEWMTARGSIVSIGDDPVVTASLVAGAWHEPRFARGESLLAPRTPAIARALQGRFSSPAAIAVDFASQSIFMEVFRADAWKRLLRGALLQRFGPVLRIPPSRRMAVPRVAKSILGSAYWAGNNFVSFAPVISYRTPSVVALPGSQVLLGAYQVEVESKEAGLPVLQLEQAAFDNFAFAAGAMRDALCVTKTETREWETLCELFRFATRTDEDELPRIVVRDAPPPEALQPFAKMIQHAATWIHALRWHPGGEEFARGFFEWFAGILRDNTETHYASVQALGLARLCDFGTDCLPLLDLEKLRALCHDVVALATRSPREECANNAGGNTVSGSSTADFARMAARAEDLLGDAEATAVLRGNSAALSAAVDRALAHLRVVIAAPIPDAAERSPAASQALLTALGRLITETPAQCRSPFSLDGTAPVARFWRIVFSIRRMEAAIRAIELAAAGQPLLALPWLDVLDSEVVPPSVEDWEALPTLLTESVEREAQMLLPAAWHEALACVLTAERALLASRGRLAFFALESSALLAKAEYFGPSDPAAGFPFGREREQARLVRALLRLSAVWEKTGGRPVLPDTLDVLEIAQALHEQARGAIEFHARSSARANASETQ